MPAGLQIYNDAGFIQIDDSYKNCAFISKGTATTDLDIDSTEPTSGVILSFTGRTNPMIAFRSSNLLSCIYLNKSGNTYNWYVYVNAPLGTTFTWYLFDDPVASGVNSGLQVFTASGVLTFESGQRYARVIDFIKDFKYGDGSPSYTYDSAKSYAFCFASPGLSVQRIPPGPGGTPPQRLYRWAQGARSITGGLAQGTWRAWQSTLGGSGTGTTFISKTDMLVLDVTGF